MAKIYIYAAAFVLTFAGVGLFVRLSGGKFLDVPNERSSHARPVPRGGGSIVVAVSLLFYFLYAKFVAGNFSPNYFVGASFVAAISLLDDVRSISSLVRITIHAAAAVLLISSIDEKAFFQEPSAHSDFVKFVGYAAALLWVVWLTNAYNFMDGIDGIAGLQAVSAGLGWLFVANILHLESVGVFGGVLAFSGFGFLIFNWQPAKVFMGDVGSAFFGYTFAALPFLAANESSSGFFDWLTIGGALVWLFFFDTFVTLIRRVARGENFWLAHRGHIYQQIVICGYSHAFTACLYGILSAFNAALVIAALYYERWFFIVFVCATTQAIGLLVFLRWAKGQVDADKKV